VTIDNVWDVFIPDAV